MNITLKHPLVLAQGSRSWYLKLPLFLLGMINRSLRCNNLRTGYQSSLKDKDTYKEVVELYNLVRSIALKHPLVPAWGSRSCKFCRTLITMSIMHCFVSITLIDLRPLCEVKFTFIFIFIYIRLTCLGKKGPCDTQCTQHRIFYHRYSLLECSTTLNMNMDPTSQILFFPEIFNKFMLGSYNIYRLDINRK